MRTLLSPLRRRLVQITSGILVTVPVVLWSMFLTFGLLRHGYGLLTSAASSLGAKGTPHAEAFNIAFFYTGGILTALAGTGLAILHHRSFRWLLGSIFMIVAGVLLFLTGVFPTAGAGHFDAHMHGLVSQWCFVLASVAPLLLVLDSKHLFHQPGLQRILKIVAVSSLVIEVLQIAIAHIIRYPYGYFQRSFMASLSIALLILGIWLKRHYTAVHHPQPLAITDS